MMQKVTYSKSLNFYHIIKNASDRFAQVKISLKCKLCLSIKYAEA
jgi:hypothetical protein